MSAQGSPWRLSASFRAPQKPVYFIGRRFAMTAVVQQHVFDQLVFVRLFPGLRSQRGNT